MAEQFDVVVLGGGPGGYAAALYGAAAGLHVALVEEARVGGTCLHRGCIPAKELLQTAEVLRSARSAAEFGVTVGEPSVDLAVSQQRKHRVIDRLVSGLEGLLKGRKVTVIPGTGTILDAASRHVRVSDGTELLAKQGLILATGSTPRSLPELQFNGTTVLSSDHVLEMTEIPERVAIVGGGAIGCEFASLLGELGSKVTIVEALPQLLNGCDRDVAQVVVRSFKKRGIDCVTSARIRAISQVGSALELEYDVESGTRTLQIDKLIVSVGRSPRTEGIGLEAGGVTLDSRGFIEVSPWCETSMEGIYAVGDVVGTPQLAHVAFAEAIVAIKSILGEDPTPVDYDKVPWGIYCHPEVAFCGMNEAAAREAGIEIEVSKHSFMGNGRALIIGETDGVVKIISKKDGPIIGVHIAGPWATELIAEGYLSVNWEATAADIGALIHAHPTLSELFGESALALTGRGLHG
ncbi:MAG: dihydrolipoyl dehydrogenase [Acidimicrobiia bacterium]